MGDQICSLNFSLTNLYFIGCVYRSGFDQWDQKCSTTGPHWAIHIALSMCPFLCRCIQSLRRWHDSRLTAHLVNAGKYMSGMLMYAFYYYWRSATGGEASFVLYILAATIYNVYACIWDYLTDWSLLRPQAKYPLLRDEVLCTDHLYFYYFAMISNFVIRFSWIMYLPSKGLPFNLRSFILAMLEMLRRWQWNFLRLENEHLGNIDQYRATRDLPLPYAFDSAQDSDADDWDQPCTSSKG
ncbi:EXS family-domain-containing protein [Thelephora terrestris]|uniref:EXS family-domain-containing protein n=1 Tax=Thelephora terrestris TaxID=56493 RepID=A0A9P6L9D2_9AGAM|nr:EXS family-domain-containing protein [Thelephora terrestris]